MESVVLELPFMSQEFNHSPKWTMSGANLVLMLEYQTETGEYQPASLTFYQVSKYSYFSPGEGGPDMAKAYDRLIRLSPERALSLPTYRIFFDERGSFEVTCKSVVFDFKGTKQEIA